MRKLIVPALMIAGVMVLILAMASTLQRWQVNRHAVHEATSPTVEADKPVLGADP